MTNRGLGRSGAVMIALISLGAASTVAQAGVWGEVANSLGWVGFDLQGQTNPLSGGADFRTTTQFYGQSFDFGIAEYRFTGPLSFEVSTGERFLNTIDLSLQTALTADHIPQPLTYEVIYDVGGQATNITGSLYIDTDLSINGFGFYDLNIDYSSRQKTDYDGRFENEEANKDFDIGPINISGNIFADLIGLLLDPLFERAGAANPFESFSGRLQLKEALEKSMALAESEFLATDGGSNDGASWALLNEAAAMPLSQHTTAVEAQPSGVIPEPAAIVLMLLGASLIASRGLRRLAA